MKLIIFKKKANLSIIFFLFFIKILYQFILMIIKLKITLMMGYLSIYLEIISIYPEKTLFSLITLTYMQMMEMDYILSQIMMENNIFIHNVRLISVTEFSPFLINPT